MIEKLKFHLLVIVFVSFNSCSSKPEFTKFDNGLFSLKYPKKWAVHDKPTQLLSISRYGVFKELFFAYNPTLVAYSGDSINYKKSGIQNFNELYSKTIEAKINEQNIELLDEIEFKRNNTTVHAAMLKITVDSKDYLQLLYFFQYLDYYVTLIATHKYGVPDDELENIISSLEIPEILPIDQFLKEVELE